MTEKKIRATIDRFKAYMDDPENQVHGSGHKESYTMGAIDGLMVALCIIKDPTFEVKSYRSEYMPEG